MVSKQLTKKMAAAKAAQVATMAALIRITEDYDPGPEPIGMRFGLRVPGTARMAWGFRAIKEEGGFSLLGDRQFNYPEPTEATRAADQVFCKFLDADVIPHLRRYAVHLSETDKTYHHFKFDFKGEPCQAVISPQGSYGYIYGVVYVGPLTT